MATAKLTKELTEIFQRYTKQYSPAYADGTITIETPAGVDMCGAGTFVVAGDVNPRVTVVCTIKVPTGESLRRELFSVFVRNFTGNCGMVALSGWYGGTGTPAAKAFMELVDSYLYRAGYSTLVGSDGDQTGRHSLNFVLTNSTGWESMKTGLNRRVSCVDRPLSSYLFYKYLKENPHPKINWE